MLGQLKQMIGHRHPIRLAWHRQKALLAAARYGFPARKLRVIGITGTDGKTTTVAMTSHILQQAGIAAGAASTSFFQVRDKTENNPTHKTSISPFDFQMFLARCVRAGCTHVIAEVSSHGLVQHRNDFLWPGVAAITNTSPEHLDYHGTMEQYRKDKGILFQMLNGKGVKVLNADDETAALYERIPSASTILYSPTRDPGSGAALWLSGITGTSASSSATLHVRLRRNNSDIETKHELILPIAGIFNLENALCAIACCIAAGVSPAACVQALSSFGGVPGRLEKVEEGQLFSVYVDFTVTPASYQKTLSAIRATLAPGKRLLVLTGSCGDRMPEKRPVIGNIVSEAADVVVVSEDETLTEDQNKVIDEIWAGIDQKMTSAHRIFDRREGIHFLLKEAKPGDAVALCGMGACTTMQTKEGLRPWDEREVARELLRKNPH